MNPNEVSVSETGEGKFTQSVQMGDHTIIADEPKNVGETIRGQVLMTFF